MSKPLYSHTPEARMAGLRRDVETLKRRPYGLGGIRFNVFNDSGTTPGFLDVTTHDYVSLVNDGNTGFNITDTGTTGLALNSSSALTVANAGSGGINIQTSGTGMAGIALTDTTVGTSGGIFITTNYKLQMSSVGGMEISDTAAGVKIYSSDSPTDFGFYSLLTTDSVALVAGNNAHQGVIVVGAKDNSGSFREANTFWGTVLFPNPPGSGITFSGVTVQITTGQAFAVVDGGGFPIFEARADGSVHIKTGHAIVADL